MSTLDDQVQKPPLAFSEWCHAEGAKRRVLKWRVGCSHFEACGYLQGRYFVVMISINCDTGKKIPDFNVSFNMPLPRVVYLSLPGDSVAIQFTSKYEVHMWENGNDTDRVEMRRRLRVRNHFAALVQDGHTRVNGKNLLNVVKNKIEDDIAYTTEALVGINRIREVYVVLTYILFPLQDRVVEGFVDVPISDSPRFW